MANLSKERIDEFKQIVKEDYGKDLTDQEASDQANNLIGFFEILYEGYCEEQDWKRRLEKEPRGFALGGEGRSCYVCHQSIYNEVTWYDKYGIKCPHCQKAVERNQIPKSIFKDRDSFYLSWQLKDNLGLHSQTVAKMVREGKIKERTIKTRDGKGIHVRIYLKKENLNLKSSLN